MRRKTNRFRRVLAAFGVVVVSTGLGVTAQAQTPGSARPADVMPEADARGYPLNAKPLPEGYSAQNPPPPEAPRIPVFFGKDGSRLNPDENLPDQGSLEEENEREPGRLEKPSLGPRKIGEEEDKSLLQRIFPFLD